MLTKQQENNLIKMIPEDCIGEDRRTAYAVITAYRDDRNLSQAITYYSLNEELAKKWFDFFAFNSSDMASKPQRGRKSKDIISYVKNNFGKTVTPKQVVDELGISLPTFYNFYNANRGFFKKIKRGEFEIINPDEERSAVK